MHVNNPYLRQNRSLNISTHHFPIQNAVLPLRLLARLTLLTVPTAPQRHEQSGSTMGKLALVVASGSGFAFDRKKSYCLGENKGRFCRKYGLFTCIQTMAA